MGHGIYGAQHDPHEIYGAQPGSMGHSEAQHDPHGIYGAQLGSMGHSTTPMGSMGHGIYGAQDLWGTA